MQFRDALTQLRGGGETVLCWAPERRRQETWLLDVAKVWTYLKGQYPTEAEVWGRI